MNEKRCMLSIIIPLYNAEKTIRKCLSSVLSQNMDLEIILVDDESVDHTKSIVNEYIENYPNVRYFYKKNGGVSSARNVGLQEAKGKYVTFVDQDDWLNKNAYKDLIGKIEKEKADMLVFGYFKDYPDRSVRMKNRKDILLKICDTNKLIEYAFFRETYRAFAAFVWNKIFKLSFLKENNIIFDSNLLRGDDVLFFSRVALEKPITIFVDTPIYHYYQREDSISHTLTRDNFRRLKDILIGYEKAITIVEKSGQNCDSVKYMKSFYVYHASVLFEIAVNQENMFEQNWLSKCIDRYYYEYCEQNKEYPERIERINRLLKGYTNE